MRALTPTARAGARSSRARRPALLERIHAGRVGCRDPVAHPGAPRPRTLAPEEVAGVLQPVRRPPHGQGRSRTRRPRRGAARRRPPARRVPRRRPRPGAERRERRDPARPSRPRRGRRRLPRRGLRRGSRSRSSPDATSPTPPPCATRSARIPLQVDANSAYTLADIETLAELDRFDLLLIEQPLQEDDIVDHATLARHLRDPGVPRRVDRVGQGRRRRARAGRGIRHQHQGRPRRRLPRGRRASTICAGTPRSRSGAAACSRPASAAPRTPRWQLCRASRCPGTCRLRAGSITATS